MSDDAIFDRYAELLTNKTDKKFVFYGSFYNDFEHGGFEELLSMYKDKKIVDSSDVFIFIKKKDDMKIVEWNNRNGFLTLIETESNNALQQHQVGMEILKMIKTMYINPLYESFSLDPPKLKMSTSKFVNFCNYDFLFHVLTILKHKVLGVPYDSQNFSIGKEKESILCEIKVNRLYPISKPRKRKSGVRDESESNNKKAKRLFRSFRNPHMESCWLNSCMQLVLAAFDHLSDLDTNGSPMWKLLLSYKMKTEDEVINPLEIRDLLLEKERMRIVSKNVQPVNRLFHYANSTTMDVNRLKHMSEASRIGQQDCKDFFECFEQNRESWDDVYNLFKFSITKATLCMHCMQESRPPGYDSHSFLMFESPQHDMSLENYVRMHLNESTDVANWRHEDGCNMIGNGKNSIRLTNVEETQGQRRKLTPNKVTTLDQP